MKNRFKFKVWDENKEEMLGPVAIDEPPDTIILQCTGLKDKNSRFIYEGDIVKDIITEECFSIVYNDQIGGFGYVPDNADNDFYCICEKLECNLIIIGNIYENPELLESGNEENE